MAVTIGSGLGGFCAIVAQPTYGATMVTPTRTVNVKSASMTTNPHPVQGGPYLAGGRTVDIGATRLLTYTDAAGTMTGDMMASGQALLLASAFGTNATLTQFGTTTAYQLGGAGGISYSTPDTQLNAGAASGGAFDMQLGVPEADNATQIAWNYHSCIITKAEWVFDRAQIVTFSYDIDAQQVENTTALITPAFSTAVPGFSMISASNQFLVGALGSETQLDGIRKCTITMTRKMDTARIFLGDQFKKTPVTNGETDITVAIDTDYTSATKPALFDIFTAGTAVSIVCKTVGATIGTSGLSNTFSLNVTNAFVETGGEAKLDGPDVVKSTINLRGTIDAANDSAIKATLITSDSAF